ncbi:MAG: hypothetical protein CBB96_07685 [Gammaproteobacteria bacterium TMED36]|nr:MAG: hypothetical protein CBB96_07685 [Gammaproteobacteria bacterium TMED36]|tara:strand:- start:5948 stop:7435 length:1488 start_codon:yes stop_codon:yes gene_type:complete
MSVAITTDSQALEQPSGLIYLYEIEFGTGTNNKLYFHPGKDLDGTESDKNLIFDGNTYIALPIVLDDIEKKADGAMNRPEITIANVETILKSGSDFKTNMEVTSGDNAWNAVIDKTPLTAETFTIDSLIGQKLIRRKTLEKYTGSATPVEFPKESYIIDRIKEKNFLSVTLELASPADLTGVRIPARTVIGKYCPWLYQGHGTNPVKSACFWKTHQQVTDVDGNLYTFYFTEKDEPLILYDHFYNANGTRKAADISTIVSIAVTFAGTGYSSTPTVTVSSPEAGGTTATATATVSNNAVTAINIVDGGSGYDGNPPTVTLSGGGASAQAQAIATLSSRAWRGDYSSSATYKPGNYVYNVTSSGNTWRAETTVQGVTPAEGNINWQAVRTYTTWNNSTAYTVNASDPRQNSYVRYTDNNVYRAIAPNSNTTPPDNPKSWTRGDNCGKLLKSCKVRYQAIPIKLGSSAVRTDSIPHSVNNTHSLLPFGGFPGSRSFR